MANTRRDKGGGSIRQRKDNTWEGRYTFTNDEGVRKTKSVYASTQSEAKRKLKELIFSMENFDDSDWTQPTNITVGEWLDTWMQEYKKNSVRPATYSSYRININEHIRPEIGSIQLQKLRPDHIQKLLNNMGRANSKRAALSSATVIKVKNIISGAMEQAIKNRILQYNPARSVTPPKLEQKEIRILSGEEQSRFMEACKGHRLEALYLLALATGMRRGEILALTWECVDLDSRSITVKSSVSRITDPDTGQTELRFAEPKTKSGRHKVPIIESMVPVLQAHNERQEFERAVAGSAWNKHNLVFCSNVGTPIEPRRVRTTLDKLTKAAGIDPITFHAIRHTFATRMLEAEVPAKVVQDVLGHSDVTLTLNTYSHVMGTTAHEQMSKIDVLFTEKPSIIKQLKDGKKNKENESGERNKVKRDSYER